MARKKNETDAVDSVKRIVDENIKLRQFIAGETNAELAEALMISAAAVSMKYRDKSWNLADIANVAAHYGVAVEDIVSAGELKKLRDTQKRILLQSAKLADDYKAAQDRLREQYLAARRELGKGELVG